MLLTSLVTRDQSQASRSLKMVSLSVPQSVSLVTVVNCATVCAYNATVCACECGLSSVC